ncbi:unnamed protein product [Fusarium venenatum]|uniref:Uncharacterized protein n=1 Tax=Fusarium venenatum TaxID=56646 RepID=A0A2L2SUI7_9HYPO|nr:uncharacterized protein FVRRES_13892 [Fusarium venenatum]CEI42108.1 unnamed protein product [Fusarium venenatum]
MSNVDRIRSAFLETSGVMQFILSRLKAERLRRVPPLKVETLDEGVKFWLHQRGFRNDDDISKLEGLSGTLCRGLLVVLHARAKLAREGKIQPNSIWRRHREGLGKQEVRAHERFDPHPYSKARGFVAGLAELSDKEVLKQCADQDLRVLGDPDNATTLLENPTIATVPETQAALGSAPSGLWDITALVEAAVAVDSPEVASPSLPQAPVTDPHYSSEADDTILDEASLEEMAMTVDTDLANSITNGDTHSLAGVFKAGKEKRGIGSIAYTPRKSGRISDVSDWRLEKDNYQTKSYTYLLPANAVKENTVFIWIEICPPGKRHPSFYATSARYEDPTNRLAFRVVYTNLSSAQEVDEYAFRSVYSAVCRANTLVDILWDGKSDEDITQTPRRYLEVTAQKEKAKPYLETLVKGGYTDTFLGLEEQEEDINEE